mmetsp:Transcript_778/g.3061  ORF Transcript_778/g.3061 Transcript_778/m.3061 type:complete len:110 (+) Transcript_778:114-443(+)
MLAKPTGNGSLEHNRTNQRPKTRIVPAFSLLSAQRVLEVTLGSKRRRKLVHGPMHERLPRWNGILHGRRSERAEGASMPVREPSEVPFIRYASRRKRRRRGARMFGPTP